MPQSKAFSLNERAYAVANRLMAQSRIARIEVHEIGNATVIDCGVKETGSLLAGRLMAECCMADLADISVSFDTLAGRPCPRVTVAVEEPIAACLLSQYAGWPLQGESFFAMASGPMRTLRGKEPVIDKLKFAEKSSRAVGVLESAQLPSKAVVKQIAKETGVSSSRVTLLVARTASLAGTLQVVARSVETCLHKLFELSFANPIISALGTAYLPPIPGDDFEAIGRTNDSILYGADVQLWVEGDDESIAAIGPQVPSSASPDHGAPFREIFERYDRDFYRIDPHLFSPARVVFNNVRTGSMFVFGRLELDLVARSFYGTSESNAAAGG